VADDDVQARAVGQLGRQLAQGAGAGRHEGRAQQQVLGRVARQRQLGRQHQLGALRMGLAGSLGDQAGIAGQVADGGVDLGQGDGKGDRRGHGRRGKDASDYHIGVHAHPDELDAIAWDALLAQQARPTPFMRHAYLRALVASGSATADTGWAPVFFSLHRAGRLVGATAAWLKSHSYGEYVFDWAWADAYARHGLDYYPKLLDAVPFTPVPGSRLLAEDDTARRLLLRTLRQWAQQTELSSAHLLFLDEDEQALAQAEGYMLRQGVQFHWHNRPDTPYAISPNSWPLCSARSARRSSRSAARWKPAACSSGCGRARRSAKPTGTSSTTATA
jgi:hypothetical protein